MRLSARNQLKGKVRSVNHGAVNSEVVLELPGGEQLVSVITRESAERLGLAPGGDAWAVIKASHILVAVE